MLRLVNKAKSLTELYQQASVVVPMALPSAPSPRLRRILSLDASSAWHTSALLSAAIESAALPSRTKDASNSDTLGNIVDLLNVHGKQSVANLQMSFSGRDGVPRSEDVGDEPKDGVRLDVDFRPADELGEAAARLRNGHRRSSKIFSQVLVSRGEVVDNDGKDGGEREDVRSRGRDSGEATSRRQVPWSRNPKPCSLAANQLFLFRYRSTLNYPLLDSCPQIFNNDNGQALKNNIAVTTSLSTDSELSGRLKSLRSTVTRLIGLEDRETLSNELAEMADEYHEGWSSGSDDGEDDD